MYKRINRLIDSVVAILPKTLYKIVLQRASAINS